MTDTAKQFKNWNVRIVRKGEGYGLNRQLTHDKDEPMVEFYDVDYVSDGTDRLGQFVSRYYWENLSQHPRTHSLDLQGDVEKWTVDRATMVEILVWVNATIGDSDPIVAEFWKIVDVYLEEAQQSGAGSTTMSLGAYSEENRAKIEASLQRAGYLRKTSDGESGWIYYPQARRWVAEYSSNPEVEARGKYAALGIERDAEIRRIHERYDERLAPYEEKIAEINTAKLLAERGPVARGDVIRFISPTYVRLGNATRHLYGRYALVVRAPQSWPDLRVAIISDKTGRIGVVQETGPISKDDYEVVGKIGMTSPYDSSHATEQVAEIIDSHTPQKVG